MLLRHFTRSLQALALCALVLAVPFLSLFVVKGLGIHGNVLAIVIILASLVKGWSNYKNSAI